MPPVRSTSWFWLKKYARTEIDAAISSSTREGTKPQHASLRLRIATSAAANSRVAATRCTCVKDRADYTRSAMARLHASGKFRYARSSHRYIALSIGACVAIACGEGDAPQGGSGGHHPAAPSDAAPDASDASDASAGGGASDSGPEAAGTSGSAACPSASQCDDGNSCTADGCNDGACTHVNVADGTKCDDGRVCTAQDTCQAGTCTGTARTSAVRALGTAYAFGGALLNETSESAGGLVTFLSPERLLFADPLGSGTC